MSYYRKPPPADPSVYNFSCRGLAPPDETFTEHDHFAACGLLECQRGRTCMHRGPNLLPCWSKDFDGHKPVMRTASLSISPDVLALLNLK